jgi:uncharacterized damage-inducible protein DinB
MDRPAADECHDYYRTYTDLVPEGDVLATLAAAPDALEQALSTIEPSRETFAYAADKWTIRELVGHVVDTERVFAARALHIARGDPAPLPGMEQDDWVRDSNAGGRALADLLAEFRELRSANVRLFASFDTETLSRRGVASEMEFTVRAIVHILAGHELHHRQVLAERYLGTGN